MAAGTVVLAHNSGGPKLDIVRDFQGKRTGYLASDVDSYAAAMADIVNLGDEEKRLVQSAARESVSRFSDEEFSRNFLKVTESLLQGGLDQD